MNDLIILIQSEFGASKDGGGRVFIEHHHHFPLKKDLPRVYGQGDDLHVQLFAAFGEPRTQSFEFFNALYSLDAVLEDNVLVIIGKYM